MLGTLRFRFTRHQHAPKATTRTFVTTPARYARRRPTGRPTAEFTGKAKQIAEDAMREAFTNEKGERQLLSYVQKLFGSKMGLDGPPKPKASIKFRTATQEDLKDLPEGTIPHLPGRGTPLDPQATQTTRENVSKTVPKKQPENRHELLAQIHSFLRNGSPNSREINKYVHNLLDQCIDTIHSPVKAYEAIFEAMIKEGEGYAASSVIDRMSKDGLVASAAIEAQMLTLLLCQPDEDPTQLLHALRVITSSDSFAESQLEKLIEVANTFNMAPNLYVSMLQSFIRGRGEDYTPTPLVVAAYLKAMREQGLLKEHFEMLDRDPGAAPLTLMMQALGAKAEWSSDSLPGLSERLAQAFVQSEYNDDDISNLLRSMRDLNTGTKFLSDVVSRIIELKGPDYTPSVKLRTVASHLLSKTGKLDESLRLLRPDEHHRPEWTGETILSEIRHNPQAVQTLFSVLRQEGIPITTTMYNVFIANALAAGDTNEALSLYAQMKEQGRIPDSFTFGSLFSLFRRIPPKNYRRFLEEPRPNFIDLRQLFYEFMQGTVIPEGMPSAVDNVIGSSPPSRRHGLTTKLLNVALRSFMRQKDYAGALVIIKCFMKFDVDLDHRTYYCVMKSLAGRLYSEIGSYERGTHAVGRRLIVKWMDRFLGAGKRDSVEFNEDVIAQMVKKVVKEEYDIHTRLYRYRTPDEARADEAREADRIASGEEAEDFYSFPSMKMMESVEPPEPRDFPYEPVPLIRLLARATYAASTSPKEEARKWVDELVEKAEMEMIGRKLF